MKVPACFLVTAVIAALMSCGSSSTGPSDPENDAYYPLTVGNTWKLSLIGFTEIDSLQQTLDIQGEINWEITADTTHDQGFQLFCWQETSILQYLFGGIPLYTDSITFVNYVAEVDSVIRAYTSPSSSIYRVWMQYPVEVGDWWYSDPEYPSRIMTVISLDSSITVPSGSYSCLHLQQTEPEFPTSYVDFFYASGIGPVKYVVHIEEDQGLYHAMAQMLEFTVN